MAQTLQRLSRTDEINFFGVRHLSPASAFHMLGFLERCKPKLVLLEGPSDANELLPVIARSDVEPPFAILSYTLVSPVDTVLYPFAEYSPEYQAIVWAIRNRVKIEFFDLPTNITVRREQKPSQEHGEYRELVSAFYGGAAELSGEGSYEEFWERYFEHTPDLDAFEVKVASMSENMRGSFEGAQAEDEPEAAAFNTLRERFMTRRIVQALERYEPKDIAVITGAYHTPGLKAGLEPLSDKELKTLEKNEIKLTLMPYSYYRLSSQSGYGAGNHAPNYFLLLWQAIKNGRVGELAARYLTGISEIMRADGAYTSTAHVIEAVRLANGLALMRGAVYPHLTDLHDAAVSLLGGGEKAGLATAFAKMDVGSAIGSLPEGVSQTALTDDVNRQLKRLKLEKYKSVVAQDLTLDLRENRRVKTEESAFLDLNRSVFFHRLNLLNISLAQTRQTGNSSWSEAWVVRWTPESEIQVVEASLLGETVEAAAAYRLKELAAEANGIVALSVLIQRAYYSRLLDEIPNCIRRLQELCVDANSFEEIAIALQYLSNLIQYGDVRNVDGAPLLPILTQLFLRGTLTLFDAAGCDEQAASDVIKAIDKLHKVSQELYEHVDDVRWVDALRGVTFNDSRNAKVSGAVAALLLERGIITDEELKTEITRRLSYGVPSDLAALWFEGLCSRNRYALLSRPLLWHELDNYIQNLDDTDFRPALVFLRRSFSVFLPREKADIVDILTDGWGIVDDSLAEILTAELSEDEQQQLDDLNDFDFL